MAIIRLKNIWIHQPHNSDSLSIFFFHSGEQIQKYSDLLPNSLDVCGRKRHPEGKSCGFKNTWIHVNEAKITTGNSIATSLKHIYSLANRTMHHKIYSDGSRCTQMKGREGGGVKGRYPSPRASVSFHHRQSCFMIFVIHKTRV